MKLIDIAEIKIGYNYKREPTSRNDKNVQISIVPVIQPRNTQSIRLEDTLGLEQASIVDAKDKYFLSTNEILFSNKGDFKASIWLGNKKVIASSAFYRIKLKKCFFRTLVIGINCYFCIIIISAYIPGGGDAQEVNL